MTYNQLIILHLLNKYHVEVYSGNWSGRKRVEAANNIEHYGKYENYVVFVKLDSFCDREAEFYVSSLFNMCNEDGPGRVYIAVIYKKTAIRYLSMFDPNCFNIIDEVIQEVLNS